MASDIGYNEQAGTFYTTLQPPAFSGSSTGLLHQVWGSRCAEVSGRVRGLSGSCLVSPPTPGASGVTDVGFPVGFFSFVPIVEVGVLLPARSYSVYYPEYWTLDHDRWTSDMNVRVNINAQSIPWTKTVPQLSKNDYIVPIYQAPVNLYTSYITAGSFRILSQWNLYGEANPKIKDFLDAPLLCYWHAFGC